ncbi:MAG: hypothetical protein LBI28_00385 [Treponema sp.]|jgi:hypothetical protein|nr:hypothetical protein [Treponema sp.]
MDYYTELDMENKFIEYLLKKNYPKESIAVDYNVGKNCRVDIAIIDPNKNVPVQLFELKKRKSKEIIFIGKEKLQKYRSFLGEKTIPAYLVFPKNDAPHFEIINIDDDELKTDINVDENKNIILNYYAQLNARINENIDVIKEKEKKVIDIFKIESWIIGIAVLVIGVLSKIGLFTLDAKDLSLLGVAIALFLIPYAGKLKILGLEFERLKDDKSEKK